jgi:hypothetical protein
MKYMSLPTQRSRVALGLLALVLALTLWVTVFAADAQAANVRLDGVRTTLTTDPDTTTLLFSVGIIPLPIYPTPIVPTPDAAKYSFPVTGGMVDAKTLAGTIRHSGGLLLAKRNQDNSWTALSLSSFTIRIDAEPDLTAIVGVGGPRLSIADLNLKNIVVKRYVRHGRAFVRIWNVPVTLNKTATDAIEATFLGGADALPDNVPLGTANVLARVAH